jgi:hypothetical protein
MSNYVEVVNGQEVTSPKTKGRTKLGYVKGADGNFRLDPNFDMAAHKAANRPVRPQHFYITLDAQGNEIERTQMSKGRPNKDFTKNADGNFVKTLPAAVEAAPETVVAPQATPVTTA